MIRAARITLENMNFFARLRGRRQEFMVCPECGGEGTYERQCLRCSGSGQVIGECECCGSITDVKCDPCEGTGFIYGKCPTCLGDKFTRRNTTRPPHDEASVSMFESSPQGITT